MGETTKIEWTEATWNPWHGCREVSPGCDHCYAQAWAKRTGRPWIPQRASDNTFFAPLRWKEPKLIFTCSLSDFFIEEARNHGWLAEAWEIIEATPWHTYQILTKRPGLAVAWYKQLGRWPEHVWIGTSVELQKYAPRLDVLARIPAKVRFVSVEPMLEPLNLRYWLGLLGGSFKHDGDHADCDPDYYCPSTPGRWCICGHARSQHENADYSEGPFGEILEVGGICSSVTDDCESFTEHPPDKILDWVICGGESDSKPRPMNIAWVENLRDQCQQAGVPIFIKQDSGRWPGQQGRLPDDLWQMKEMPNYGYL